MINGGEPIKIGIKVGSRDGIEVLQRSNAQYCEVWFRLEWFKTNVRETYVTLFEFMKKKGIKFGLHFWAVVFGKYFPNLVYCKDGIAEETEALIRQTIDIAAEYGAFYVNYHPESYRLLELDLDKQEERVVPNAEVNEEEGFKSLLRHSANLKQYGIDRNVEIYIETVPKYVGEHYRDARGRLKPQLSKGIETDKLIEMGKRGFSLCFDISHAIGQYPNEAREVIFPKILEEAKQMVSYTRLVHVNTTLEPLNGTDSHNGILEDDFKLNVFPNKEQLITLINVFKANPEVLLIPEPQQGKMVENYRELQKLFG